MAEELGTDARGGRVRDASIGLFRGKFLAGSEIV
jgi:hypothetical protein